MTGRDDFLVWVKTALYDAELALHNGDAGPRRALWSRTEPVSVLGAWRNAYRQRQVYRREGGEWTVAHRHADTVTQ